MSCQREIDELRMQFGFCVMSFVLLKILATLKKLNVKKKYGNGRHQNRMETISMIQSTLSGQFIKTETGIQAMLLKQSFGSQKSDLDLESIQFGVFRIFGDL